MTGTVLVIAKAPRPGRSKTRLVPPLGPDEAVALHTALLLDTLETCRAEVSDTGLLYASEEEREPLAALAGSETPLVAQSGLGLGDALMHAMRDGVEQGPLLIVASDIPGVPPGAIAEAFTALARKADVVLGPALDGGYWAIGMNDVAAAPFTDIPWSTPAVLAVTLARCADAGLRVHLLAAVRDVDTPADLAALAREPLDRAPRTSGVIAELVDAHRLADDLPPTMVASDLLFSSPWRAGIRDTLIRRDGGESAYTYLAVPRAVFVVPVTDSGDLLLVRQYRHPVREWTREVPAGSVLDGESAPDAARRELAEEIGGHARELTHLTTFFSSSAHLSLRSDIYLATSVELGTTSPDEGEELRVERLPLAVAAAEARAGRFTEGQTALAVLLAAEHLHVPRSPVIP